VGSSLILFPGSNKTQDKTGITSSTSSSNNNNNNNNNNNGYNKLQNTLYI